MPFGIRVRAIYSDMLIKIKKSQKTVLLLLNFNPHTAQPAISLELVENFKIF